MTADAAYIGQYTGVGEVAVSLKPRRRRAGKRRAEKGCKADRVLAAGTSLGGEGEGPAALTPWGWGAGPADRSPSPPVAGGLHLGVAAPGVEITTESTQKRAGGVVNRQLLQAWLEAEHAASAARLARAVDDAIARLWAG